jgi:hypothetical protein
LAGSVLFDMNELIEHSERRMRQRILESAP